MAGIKRAGGWRNRRGFTLAAAVAVVAGAFAMSGTSSADVTAVSGSAYGYYLSVGLFGGPPTVVGPTPTISLPPGGTANAASGSASAGPARFFTSGPITVTSNGTTGPTGSVTSSASITNVNNSGQESFGYPSGPGTSPPYTSIASTCTVNQAGPTGSTTITNGILQLDNGDDAPGNVHPPVNVILPTNPAPNTEYIGHIHVNGAQDNFRFVFNEQFVSGNTITVNAAHEYLLGPTAIGELIIGHSVCNATVTAPTTTTTRPTTTTTRPTTSTTRPTTTTTRPSTTTTTRPSTTTTRPSTTTTRVPPPPTTTTIPDGPTCAGRPATIVGTPGPDQLVGTSRSDVIVGLGGDDMIAGLEGNDFICAGGGNDSVDGGPGNDTIGGGAGMDRIAGGPGNDTLRGGAGRDIIDGGTGTNVLNGGPEIDTCVSSDPATSTFISCEIPAQSGGSAAPMSFSSGPALRPAGI
ncbi:MAG: hypothetical protein H0T70_08010 [Acidimicrobiia bacterium]|nr:hypothetical protein [Acidimicrobiia bacterium]